MFFKLFSKAKNKPFVACIIYVLITFYIISVNGCETTTADRYTSESLKNQKKLEGITHIVLKNGTYINTEDKTVFYYDKYRDSSNVFVIITEDTLREVIKGVEFLKFKKTESFLPLSSVQEVYVTRTEIDAGKTIIASVGIAVGATLAALFILAVLYLSTPHNNSCPYIYSFDGSKYVYDAEPLGGVICEALARTDYSRLEHIAPSDGKFKLFIRNENDEQQHLDEMKLIAVKHEESASVTPSTDGKFYKYKTILPPVSVTDENGNDITAFFTGKDEYRWYSEINNFGNQKDYPSHKLKLKFKKPVGAKSALFFFNGGISQIGSGMVKSMLELRGNKINGWYNELNKRDAELKNLHEYILSEETYYLKVNLLESGEYKVKAIIPGGGPKVDEDKVFSIPIENVNGDYVEIELNPPQGYWKIEQVGLIYDYKEIEKEDINVIDASFAKDRRGIDITTALNSTDKNYYDMPEVGNSFNLNFDVPKEYKKETFELFLKTSGWYEINIDKSRQEQTELINDIFTNPGKIIDYTIMINKQKAKEFTAKRK
jgi:hypothetical protein